MCLKRNVCPRAMRRRVDTRSAFRAQMKTRVRKWLVVKRKISENTGVHGKKSDDSCRSARATSLCTCVGKPLLTGFRKNYVPSSPLQKIGTVRYLLRRVLKVTTHQDHIKTSPKFQKKIPRPNLRRRSHSLHPFGPQMSALWFTGEVSDSS